LLQCAMIKVSFIMVQRVWWAFDVPGITGTMETVKFHESQCISQFYG
jgi:hypothetical protein